MIPIKIDGQRHEMPTRWEEVKWKTYLKLLQPMMLTEATAILLGFEPDHFRKLKVEGLQELIRLAQFTTKPPEINKAPSNLGPYVFPKRIELEQVGQFEDVRKELELHQAKEGEQLGAEALYEATKALAFYAAVYCQAINEPYDTDKARALAESFDEMPCTEVLAAGTFFMMQFFYSHSPLQPTSLMRNLQMRRKRPGLAKLLGSLGFMRL